MGGGVSLLSAWRRGALAWGEDFPDPVPAMPDASTSFKIFRFRCLLAYAEITVRRVLALVPNYYITRKKLHELGWMLRVTMESRIDWRTFDWSKVEFRQKVEHILLSTGVMEADHKRAKIYIIASNLLFDTSKFLENNTSGENAEIFAKMSTLLRQNPDGHLGEKPIAKHCAAMLRDAATLFENLAKSNPEYTDDLTDHARAFYSVAYALEKNPFREI